MMIGRNDPCWCGSGNKWKKCHAPDTGDAAAEKITEKYYKTYGIIIKSAEQIEGIRRACALAAQILKQVASHAKKGITTNQLNTLAESLHKAAGATAAPLGYGEPPFPKSICTSKNDVICHGIPDDVPLENGDIINIDITCILDGYYGDCSCMVAIGEISEEKQRVMTTAKICLDEAIKILRPKVMISDIGKVIEHHARDAGCSVVTQFIGHGTGVMFHEAPQVPHHYNEVNIPLVAGMTFTIEPMINAGVEKAVIDKVDRWTARTADGKASAQWEHTVLITADGCEVLTKVD
jgi:methionyl aminopeptidase